MSSTTLTNPIHAIREQMALRGGAFVQQLSIVMRYADDKNLKRLVKTFPEIMERYDALATTAKSESGPETTRYFSDGTSIWKFEPGKQPQNRFKEDSEWEESAFTSLQEFEKSPGNTREITSEDGGEP